MSLIVLKVKESLGRWAIMHNDVPLATFAEREEAERAALAVAAAHPPSASAELDLETPTGLSSIRVF